MIVSTSTSHFSAGAACQRRVGAPRDAAAAASGCSCGHDDAVAATRPHQDAMAASLALSLRPMQIALSRTGVIEGLKITHGLVRWRRVASIMKHLHRAPVSHPSP